MMLGFMNKSCVTLLGASAKPLSSGRSSCGRRGYVESSASIRRRLGHWQGSLNGTVEQGNIFGPNRTRSTSTAPVKLLLQHSGHVIRAAWQNALEATGSNVAIDATAGRGSDTLLLCELLGHSHGGGGKVHAIDIQRAATLETERRYEELTAQTTEAKAKDKDKDKDKMASLRTHTASHEDLAGVTGVEKGSVGVITYNLGWLPMREADKGIITTGESTVASLHGAAELVCPGGGVISIMAYVGHEGGLAEKDAVVTWAGQLCAKSWKVLHIDYPNRDAAPHLVLCVRA